MEPLKNPEMRVRPPGRSRLPDPDRQAGMSLDSMSVEVSYSIGPALGVVAVTRLGSSTAMPPRKAWRR